MNNTFALDVEVTTNNTGDPFDTTNSLVLGVYGTDTDIREFLPKDVGRLQVSLDEAKRIILFNAKFDLHWLRRIGVKFDIRLPIWDCQLAEFILSNQKWKYPSLDEACSRRGLGNKIDVIKNEYWNKGINTDEIPMEILRPYAHQDCSLTYRLYLDQLKDFQSPEHRGKYKLFRLQCYDLMVLQEMEYNGYKFDTEASLKEATTLEEECNRIDSTILAYYPDVPINLGSNDHISCMLYGGTIVDTIKIPVGTYKSGTRQGEVKYRNMDQEYVLPRLVEPLKGSELAKEGYYATSEDILKTLESRGSVTKIINLLLERRGLEKLRGTYYEGVPKLIEKHHWENNIVHGQLNQCVAGTGRLSATKPNQQNMPPGCKTLCISRYNE